MIKKYKTKVPGLEMIDSVRLYAPEGLVATSANFTMISMPVIY